MREIKFRGKHIHAFLEPRNTGIWVYGYLCNDHYINSEELMGEMLVDKNTIGQYTGLKDKNGKEIYEGDILRFSEVDTAIVEWNEKYSYFMVKPIQDYYFDSDVLGNALEYSKVEVIGNIYDNPELLKEENK